MLHDQRHKTVSFRFLRNSPLEGGSSRETAGGVTVALRPSLITFAFDLCPFAFQPRLRQRPERQVLQCSLRHNQEIALFQAAPLPDPVPSGSEQLPVASTGRRPRSLVSDTAWQFLPLSGGERPAGS